MLVTKAMRGVVARVGKTRATQLYSAAHRAIGARRSYGASHDDHHDDHHHVKPHKTTFRQPLPMEMDKTAAQRKQELQESAGWLFGSQVVYVDPEKPYTHQYQNANGWLWGRPPRAPGQPYDWEDWEAISYGMTAIIVAMVLLFAWAKVDFDVYDWAEDEVTERRIIKKRQEKREELSA